MALKNQLLGLGSSIYNLAGSPLGSTFGGALQGAAGLGNLVSGNLGGISNLFQGANTLSGGGLSNAISSLGSNIFGDTFSGLGGLLSGIGPGLGAVSDIIGTISGHPSGLAGFFGGMTAQQNLRDSITDVQTNRSRLQDIGHDPQGWLAGQGLLQDISRASLGGNLSVSQFQDMLLGNNNTPELKGALNTIMHEGRPMGGWQGNPMEGFQDASTFPWGHLGDQSAISGGQGVFAPGWPAGMINPLELDLTGTESRGRGGPVGIGGPWAARLFDLGHNNTAAIMEAAQHAYDPQDPFDFAGRDEGE